jgi:hypothetical protein
MPVNPHDPARLSAGQLAMYRLALAARAFSSAKSGMEEEVAGRDLMRAAIEYARCVSEKLVPLP